MTDVLIHNFEYIMKVRERIIFALVAASVAAAGVYGYFVEKTIANTAALSSIQSALTDETATLSDLSTQYVAVSSQVTLNGALAEGYTEAPVSAFITVLDAPAPADGVAALSVNVPNAF